MDFKTIEKDFERNRTSRYSDAIYNTYHIKWAFENFEELILKPTFQSNLTVNLDFQMSQNLIHELDFEIDKLRNLYKATSSTLQKYLSELNNEVIMMTTYQDFLNNFYKYFKDYVNEGLIPWVYANVFYEPVRLNNYDYDSGYYLQLMYAQLELKLMKKMKQYIKRITKELPDDQVFNLLLASYDQEIIEREKNIKILKSQSFL